MRPKSKIWPSLFGVALLLASTTAAAAGADEHDHDHYGEDAVFQTNEEALQHDLELVADAKGWTYEQAAADYETAEALGEIAALVAQERPNMFVGSELSEEPGGPAILYIKGDKDVFIDGLVAAAAVDIVVRDGMPFSFEELEQRQIDAHNSIVSMGYDNVGSSSDFDGQISVSVALQSGLEDDPDEIAKRIPESLRQSVTLTVNAVDTPSNLSSFGGMRGELSNNNLECTSGWSVKKGSSTGVTFAGHCVSIARVDHNQIQHSTTFKAQHIGSWGDVEWRTTASSEPDDFYANSSTIRDTTAIEPRAGISVNESICYYGRASNWRDCGLDVEDTSLSCTIDGITAHRLVTMDDDGVAGIGDSGGGFSFDTRAYGGIKGTCLPNLHLAFSVADLFDEAIGVTVLK